MFPAPVLPHVHSPIFFNGLNGFLDCLFWRIALLDTTLHVPFQSHSDYALKEHESDDVLGLISIVFEACCDKHSVAISHVQIDVVNQATSPAESGKADLGDLWPSCLCGHFDKDRFEQGETIFNPLLNFVPLVTFFDEFFKLPEQVVVLVQTLLSSLVRV